MTHNEHYEAIQAATKALNHAISEAHKDGVETTVTSLAMQEVGTPARLEIVRAECRTVLPS